MGGRLGWLGSTSKQPGGCSGLRDVGGAQGNLWACSSGQRCLGGPGTDATQLGRAGKVWAGVQQGPTWPRQAGLPCPQADCGSYLLAARYSRSEALSGLDQGCRWRALASRARQCWVPRKRRQRSWRPRRHCAPVPAHFLRSKRCCDDVTCLQVLCALYVTLRHRAGPASCRSGVAAGGRRRFAALRGWRPRRAALVWHLRN